MPLTLKHFRSGSTYPEPTPGKLRLYSMHSCPYAQRTKLFIGAFYKVMLSHTEDKEAIENMFSALDEFELDVKKRGTPFLGGDKPMMVDLNVWPHIMRIPHLAYSFNNPEVEISPDRFPAVTSWINKMEEIPAVQQTNLNKDQYKQFVESYKAKKVDYD
ncbi:SEPIA-like protein, partial [Mya arenaria]